MTGPYTFGVDDPLNPPAKKPYQFGVDDPLNPSGFTPPDLNVASDARYNSNVGMEEITAQSNQALIDQLTKSIAETKDPARLASLQNRLAAAKKDQGFKFAPSLGESAGRVVKGVIAAPFSALAGIEGMAGRAENLGEKALGINTGIGKRFADIGDEQTAALERMGVKGPESLLGNFIGSMGIGAAAQAGSKVAAIANVPNEIFGSFGRATLKFLGKFAPSVSRGLQALQQSGRLGSAAATAIGDIPFNLTNVGLMEDAQSKDKVKAFGIQGLGSLAAGFFGYHGGPIDGGAPPPPEGGAPAPGADFVHVAGELPPGPMAPERGLAPGPRITPAPEAMKELPAHTAYRMNAAGEMVVDHPEIVQSDHDAINSFIYGENNDAQAAIEAVGKLANLGVTQDDAMKLLAPTRPDALPIPKRLELLASGTPEPDQVRIATRQNKIDANTISDQLQDRMDLGGGKTMWRFKIAGQDVTLSGMKDEQTGKFVFDDVSSSGGDNSVGLGTMRKVARYIQKETGATAYSGLRIAGAGPGRRPTVELPPTTENLIGYRSAEPSGFGPTEGEGTYVSKEKTLAYRLGQGKVVDVSYPPPKNALVVRDEPLPVLENRNDILTAPVKEGDSPWIKLNKDAARRSGPRPAYADTEAWRKADAEWTKTFARQLSKAARAEGYDAFDFNSRGDQWHVLLGNTHKVGKPYEPGGTYTPTKDANNPLAEFKNDELMSGYYHTQQEVQSGNGSKISEEGDTNAEALRRYAAEAERRGIPVYGADSRIPIPGVSRPAGDVSRTSPDQSPVQSEIARQNAPVSDAATRRAFSQVTDEELLARWRASEDLISQHGTSASDDKLANLMYSELTRRGALSPETLSEPQTTPPPAISPAQPGGAGTLEGELLPTEQPKDAYVPPVPKGPAQGKAFEVMEEDPSTFTKPRQFDQAVKNLLAPIDAGEVHPMEYEYNARMRDIARLNKIRAEKFPDEQLAKDSGPPPLDERPFDQMSVDERTDFNVRSQEQLRNLPPGTERDHLVERIMDFRQWNRDRISNPETDGTIVGGTTPLDKLDDAAAYKAKEPKGYTLHTPPEVYTTLIGFFAGLATPTDDPEEKWAWAVGGAMAGYFAGRVLTAKVTPRVPPPRFANQEKIREIKTSMLDKPKDFVKVGGFPGIMRRNLSWLERKYQSISRPTHAVEKFYFQNSTDKEIGLSMADNISSFGVEHQAMTAEWLFNKPVKYVDGNPVPMQIQMLDAQGRPHFTDPNVMSLAEIIASVKGDTPTLGDVSLGLAALEHGVRRGKLPHPDLNPVELQAFIGHVQQTAPEFIEAAKRLRQFHLGMTSMLKDAGMISDKLWNKINNELWYTSLERVFGSPDEEIFGTSLSKIRRTDLGAPEPIKRRGVQSEYQIRDPIESAALMAPRIFKAIEVNSKRVDFANFVDGLDLHPTAKAEFGKQMGVSPKLSAEAEIKVAKLREAQPELDRDEAVDLLYAFDGGNPLGPDASTFAVKRNGVRQVWRINKDFVDAFQYMNGWELAGWWKGIRGQLTTAAATAAKFGTGTMPDFIARMGYFDVWQSWMNSRVGWGGMPLVDFFNAYSKAWKRSPEWQTYGGSKISETLIGQGMIGADNTIRRLELARKGRFEEAGASLVDAGKNIVHGQVKTSLLDVANAYRTLLEPLASAGRFSEWLRSQGRGESVLQSLRAANAVGGYYNQAGRAANGWFRAVPFMRGALQSMDQMLTASGVHPFRVDARTISADVRKAAAAKYFVKAMATMTVPTAIFYAMNAGDKEIQNLRQSETGRRYWYMRNPVTGGIINVRKPPGPDGALFTTTLELALDHWRDQEPDAFGNWVKVMGKETAIPWINPGWAWAIGMGTGTDVSFGTRITGGEDVKPTSMQASAGTSQAAQALSQKLTDLAPGVNLSQPGPISRLLSPEGIQYTIRELGGTLAQDALKAIDVGLTYKRTGMLPAAKEWPVVRKFADIDETRASTRSLEDFYNFAQSAEKASQLMTQAAESGDYQTVVSVMKKYGRLGAMSTEILSARKSIADIRQGMEDLRTMPGLDGAQRQRMMKTFHDQMIAEADGANAMVRAIQKSQ